MGGPTSRPFWSQRTSSFWKEKVNKVINKTQELLHFAWQRTSVQTILESLELHSYDGTVKAIKTRECLDKLDRRDIALSTFAMSRNKTLLPFARTLRAMKLTTEDDNTAACVRLPRITLTSSKFRPSMIRLPRWPTWPLRTIEHPS
jgi:hypothetical protein